MRRREFIALTGASVALPFAAMAQQAGRTYHLGCLLPGPPNDYVAFFDGLRRRGFIESQNLTVEYRAYAQHVDLIPQYAAELVKARVDVIAASGDEAARTLQQATKTDRCDRRRYAGVSTRWRDQTAIQRASASSCPRLRANDRIS